MAILQRLYQFIGTFGLISCVVMTSLFAAEAGEVKVLFVRVGECPRNSGNPPLHRIDADILYLEESISRLYGIDAGALKQSEAIREAAAERFHSHLIERREAGILFFFEGHGQYVPDTSRDDSDGIDEALLLFYSGMLKRETFVSDNMLAARLCRIHADNVIVIFDCYHLGTATRGFNLEFHWVEKSAVDHGMLALLDEMPKDRVFVASCDAGEKLLDLDTRS
ncbi:MAG: hypothetical protein AAF236_06940 [Verrucomicrobiota bacterium]